VRRRGATLLVGAVVVVLLVVASFAGIRVPYVALTPGPTWNTLGSDHNKQVIQVAGGPVSATKGQLRLVTVGVEDQLTLFDALRGWLSGDDAVVPREVVYPPNESQQQVDQENAQEFKTSQNAAVIAALRALHYAITVVVTDVSADGPATGHLAKGDVITLVDGQPVTSADKLNSLVQGKPSGTTLTIGYQRGGTAGTTRVTTVERKGSTPLGIQVDVRESGAHQYKVTFGLENVGGPSAGLMFTLGIIDKLGSSDLTGGRVIAGTGTIDQDGNVGAIGGIPQKMRGARRDGATVFLAPASNCAEAVANAVPGLVLVKVNTLDDALRALDTLRAGGTPTLCAAK
jgi:PDZ domain-containing protein